MNNKFDIAINKFIYICKMGIKRYSYFLKMQYDIDNYFQIIRDANKLKRMALKNYLIAKIKFISIIIAIILLFIVCSNFLNSHYENPFVISDMVIAISKLDDAWIGFLGEIIGGLITVFGVWMTIYFNIRQDRQTKLQQSQPIVILDTMLGCEHPDDKTIVGANLKLRTHNADAENTEIPVTEFTVRNIGFNTAINVSFSIEINGFEFSDSNKYITLKKDELATFKSTFIVDKQILLKILSKQINLFYRSASNMIRNIKLNVGEVHGFMNLYYQDVYENENIKIIPVKIQFLKKSDDEYMAELNVDKAQNGIIKFIKKKVL